MVKFTRLVSLLGAVIMSLLGAVIVSLLGALIASATSSIVYNAANPSRIQSEYLLSVRPNILRGESLKMRMDDFVHKIEAFSDKISVIARYDFNTLSILHINSPSMALVSRLYDFPEVSSIEANLFQKVTDEECEEQTTEPGLWGLARIGKREDSSDNIYSYKEDDGAGGFVYIVDSGIRLSHNDFSGRAIHGFTITEIPEPSDDLWGHGTHVAGTVMGTRYGIAKSAGAIAVKVLNAGGFGSTSGTISGMNWIKNDFIERDERAGGNFPAVASMSLGFSPSDSLDGAVQELYDTGLVVTAAAGNNASEACTHSPARANASIAVMASDVDNALSAFSNHGKCADIIAPGVDILSAYNRDDDDFRLWSGTSMATPHVAGVLLRRMTQVIAATGRRPSPAELKEWLLENGTKDVINTLGWPNTNNILLYAPCDVTA